jgi:medium-chain acyl-[acyl-carrier-protein] hydrolase
MACFFKLKTRMETNGIWTETVIIPSFMVNKDLEATFVTIGNLFQEAAGNHAIYRKLGYFDLKEQNMMWVLNRLKIQMVRFPKWREAVIIKTWVSDMQPFSNRHYLLQNTEGVDIGYGSALWIPIDATTFRPKRVTIEDSFLLIKELPCGLPSKLNEITDAELCSERQVKYADIDFLSHVNNVQYISWILDDFYAQSGSCIYKTLEINYLNQCSENDSVSIFYKKVENELYYSIKRNSDDKEICRAHFY